MNREDQGLIWDFYKPRHTHSWNMLFLSWNSLDGLDVDDDSGFEIEYCWENFIIRLWLYRTTVKTLTKLDAVRVDANNVLELFDSAFDQNGKNSLKTLRDMIEHFDDYAAGDGRGPARRETDLDPWRPITKDYYERGNWLLERSKANNAAISLRTGAKATSDKFTNWYKSNTK